VEVAGLAGARLGGGTSVRTGARVRARAWVRARARRGGARAKELEELESLILILNLILAQTILGILSRGSGSLVDDGTIGVVGISSLSTLGHLIEGTSEVTLSGLLDGT
jgi:hypothetical protein